MEDKRITVEELIEKLKNYDKKLFVEIQFRDDGGEYTGTDEYLYFSIRGDRLIL